MIGAITFVDTVMKAAPFTGGADAETDAALRVRFVGFINSLSTSTVAAINYTISALQLNIWYTISENIDLTNFRPGFFTSSTMARARHRRR
jgi:hypothetical protein